MKYIPPYVISGFIGSFLVSLMSLIHHSFVLKIPNTPKSFIIPVAVGFVSGISIQYFKTKWENEAIEKENTKLETLREVTGAVCHELNQPLMVINGYLEMLIEDFSEKDIGHKNIMEIQKQTKRISDLIDKMTEMNDYVTKPYLSGKIVDIEQSYIEK
ncbi:histidine kinase dimerization/phospho-acceptor domain-containing protein [Desulfospira joergensenii]|uniref:histidine kinase dimerization/phospho-acceptor domain-containing protein n=1 Tax=Desulfospira joergensenii TaxID=53329 RepID=UPI0003B4557B|nr:histidine kinase dimerization/phospho-acceptor domain-containing protein [Desulfospira joergensenii]